MMFKQYFYRMKIDYIGCKFHNQLLKKNRSKILLECFTKLVVNVEKLKQQRIREKYYTEIYHKNLLKRCFKSWIPACELLNKRQLEKFTVKRYFKLLKQNWMESKHKQSQRIAHIQKVIISRKYLNRLKIYKEYQQETRF